MASDIEVKTFVACWMQLGKGICEPTGEVTHLQTVVQGERYSPEFETLWRRLSIQDWQNTYLEGTSTTLSELNTPTWEILPCARCTMPIAMPMAGVASSICPCHDLPNWPNTELPVPRPPIQTSTYLNQLTQRLKE